MSVVPTLFLMRSDPLAQTKVQLKFKHGACFSSRCDFDDTAQYHVSAMNAKGEQSAYASVVVKSTFHHKMYS